MVSIGVSISRNPSSAMNCLAMVATLLFMIRFLWRSGRLRSRYLYLSLISSLVLLFSSIGNGGVSASDSIRRLLATTSMSPVARFSFTAPARLHTVPSMAATNSERSFPAFSKHSAPHCDSSNITCNIPLLSRRSTKIIPPLFLLF